MRSSACRERLLLRAAITAARVDSAAAAQPAGWLLGVVVLGSTLTAGAAADPLAVLVLADAAPTVAVQLDGGAPTLTPRIRMSAADAPTITG